MECRIAKPEEIDALSKLSVKFGNVPFFEDQCVASLLLEDEKIIGFAAVQTAWHAAGSWVKEEYRKQGLTYTLRTKLENDLRRKGVGVYFALPGNEFEKALFAKYGHVIEHVAQVRHL